MSFKRDFSRQNLNGCIKALCYSIPSIKMHQNYAMIRIYIGFLKCKIVRQTLTSCGGIWLIFFYLILIGCPKGKNDFCFRKMMRKSCRAECFEKSDNVTSKKANKSSGIASCFYEGVLSEVLDLLLEVLGNCSSG